MKRADLKQIIREIINEKKNDFVAYGEQVLISIHNSPDDDVNMKLYNKLVSFVTKLKRKPKKIDITY